MDYSKTRLNDESVEIIFSKSFWVFKENSWHGAESLVFHMRWKKAHQATMNATTWISNDRKNGRKMSSFHVTDVNLAPQDQIHDESNKEQDWQRQKELMKPLIWSYSLYWLDTGDMSSVKGQDHFDLLQTGCAVGFSPFYRQHHSSIQLPLTL